MPMHLLGRGPSRGFAGVLHCAAGSLTAGASAGAERVLSREGSRVALRILAPTLDQRNNYCSCWEGRQEMQYPVLSLLEAFEDDSSQLG